LRPANGRIVKLIGDGTIVEFGSVVDAVNCALSVQRRNGALPDGALGQPKIVLRMGINLGDVIIEGDDIYGDGISLALCSSRVILESAIQPASDR
jgi:adenylate cyclase